MFSAHDCTSEFFTLKTHFLNWLAEELEGFLSMSFKNEAPFEASNVLASHSNRMKSRRLLTGMLETVHDMTSHVRRWQKTEDGQYESERGAAVPKIQQHRESRGGF